MTNCPKCDAHVTHSHRFCQVCGTDLRGSVASTLHQRKGPAKTSGEVFAGNLAPGLSSSARFPPGTLLGERYRVVGLLGRGGMGEVYRADDLKLSEPVALKLLPRAFSGDEELLARLYHEVKIARRISHAAVCRVFDIGQAGDQHFLSMELVDGENLATLLRRIGRLPPEKVAQVASELCDGLAAAHDQGVLHRDFKPANVMIDGRGRARITDFGLAGLEDELARLEVRSGTPAYMAPEQLASGQVSVRSDLYSLGAVLYEALTGQRPFPAADVSELAHQQEQGRCVAPSTIVPGISPLTDQLLLRCLGYDPDQRPASAAEVASALAEAFEVPGAVASASGAVASGAAGSGAMAPVMRPQAPLLSDHRQVTALFCDLAGATALAARLDSEELSELLRAFQKAAGDVVERFGGHVAQRLGDGLRSFFGYPWAHEDDARRAVYAGLEILEAVERLNYRAERDYGVHLDVRASVHTESVVAQEVVSHSRRDLVAAGPTLSVAALLLERTRTGALLISAATFELVQAFVVCKALGPFELKGVEHPVEVYQVRGKADWASRFELAVTGNLTRLVGRDLERALLGRCLDRVRDSYGQAVLITGEAGIGKTRLLYVIREMIAGASMQWLFCRCSPYETRSAFHPVVRLLRSLVGIHQGEPVDRQLHRLEKHLKLLGFEPTGGALPLLAALLALPLEVSEQERLSPPERKEETLHLLLDMMFRMARRKPLVLVVEDLHWIDPSSLAFLELMVSQVSAVPLLIAMTARPELKAPWACLPHVTTINLDRLGPEDVRAMIDDLTDERQLPGERLEELLARTDGIPLAVEELTRGLMSDSSESPSAIPATLRDSLEARLDRLGPFREVAQVAATIGREFSYKLLEAVAPLESPALRQGLSLLVEEKLLVMRGLPPESTYMFRHALIQETAYSSLMSGERRHCHGRVARVLIEEFPDVAESRPELVAHHATEAGDWELAARYRLLSGRLANAHFANPEAIDHLRKGLELLPMLAPTAERDQLELHLSLALGPPLMKTRGFAHASVEQVYDRVRLLCHDEIESPLLAPVLGGLWQFYLSHAQLETAREVAEQLLRLAEEREASLLALAHSTLGQALFFLGKPVAAGKHFARGLEYHDHEGAVAVSYDSGHDPAVACLCFGGWCSWTLGFPDQAREQVEQALARARRVASPFVLAEALFAAACVHQLRRQADAVLETVSEALELATEKKFGYWLPVGVMLRGWAVAAGGEVEDGIRQMQEGLADYRERAGDHLLPWVLSLLAESLTAAGQVDQGLRLLDEALEVAGETREHWWDAELHRLRGEALRLTGGEAESSFRQALEVARRQGARSMELRATASLSEAAF